MNIEEQISNIDLFKDLDFIKEKKVSKSDIYSNNTLSLSNNILLELKEQIITLVKKGISSNICKEIFTKALTESYKFEHIDIRGDSLLPRSSIIIDLVYKLKQMINGYDNIICSSLVANILRDSHIFKHHFSIKNGESIYSIGSLFNTKIWIDQYMSYSDTRIITFNSIYLDSTIEVYNEEPNLTIKTHIYHETIDSKIIYLLSDESSDSVINDWIRINRDKKINNLLNE